MFKLTNVDLFWAFLNETNQLSGKYQVDVCNLSDAQIERLEEEGIIVKNKDDDRGHFITCKSTKFPITAYDRDGNEIHAKVANNSKADVLVKPYSWKSPTGKKGISAGIAKLIVTDLIEYKAAQSEELIDDDVAEIL